MIKKILKGALPFLILLMPSWASAEKLTILHINDHHSHLEANGSMSLDLDGESTRVRSGGFPSVVTKIKELRSENPNSVTLHAGDATNGTLYFTLFDGEADAALMNSVCFDAFVVGNHEFNNGDEGLATFHDFLNEGKCQTPVLGANVQPEVGVSPLAKSSADDYIQPYTVVERNGEKVGIIGIVISKKTKMSSNPDDTTMFLDEVTTAQKYADELKAQGVDRVILLSHYGYDNDLALAQKTSGIDIIVGGDSHSLLGDLSNLGLNPNGSYPTMVSDASGNDVCVVTAWHENYL